MSSTAGACTSASLTWPGGVARRGDALAVVVLDLDHFKRINDTMGHAAGDDVLVTLGRSLNAAARARAGGYVRTGAAWSLTTSVGVALVFDIDSYETSEELQALLGRLMADADCCLYQAKSDGRDRVVGPSATVRPARVRLGGSRRAEDLSHPHP